MRWRRGPLDNRTRHHGSTHDRSTRHHCSAHHYDGHGHISDNPDSDNAITNATDWTPLVYTDNLIDSFGPSGTVEYKDTDPYLLGLIAEHHGGDTLNRLYADRFFLPLGISAGLVPQDAYPADMAHPYGDLSYYAMSEGFGDIVEAVWWMDHFESRKQAAWALTGIVSTPEDVARWAWELFSPSGTAVTPAVRSTLLGSVPTESIRLGSNPQRYGYHFAEQDLPMSDGSVATMVGAPGGGGGWSANMRYSATDDLAIAFLANSDMLIAGACDFPNFLAGPRDCVMIRILEAFRG